MATTTTISNNYDFINFSEDDSTSPLNFPITFDIEPAELSPLRLDMNNASSTSLEERSDIQVPTHPIPSMQGAFAESMLEVAEASPPIKTTHGSSAVRRKVLLDQDITEETHAYRWRQRPGQKWHELRKLMAQISFGIYLLLNGIAKDDEQVMQILQGHVDEIDEFLETTLDDFDLAQEDIEERLKFLKLPLENIVIFDAMLEDRAFRTQIVSGNERIEHVIQRTASAMKDALQDVQQGLDACKEFTIYLAEEQEVAAWRTDRPDMEKVFDAMKGNVEGWYKAYVTLQTKGNDLGVALVQLGTIVAEMDRRAGDISRKTTQSVISQTSTTATTPPSSPPRQSRQMRLSTTKNTPSDRNTITPAIRSVLPVFQMVQERERSPEPVHRISPEPESEPEPEFILKPRTYSPAPSPRPPQPSPRPREASPRPSEASSEPRKESPRPGRSPQPREISQAPVQVIRRPSPVPQVEPLQAAPEITHKTSLRKRFSNSLRRKDTPSEITLRPPPSKPEHKEERQRQVTATTPPSRGPDSAYCSDLEKPLSPPNRPRQASRSPHRANPSPVPPPSAGSHRRFPTPPQMPVYSACDFPLPPSSHSSQAPPSFTHNYPLPSPRSEQGHQFFRPVNASPHSPLQRPWTAGQPGSPLNSNPPHQLNHQKSFNPSSYARQPSRMGMSMVSETTMVTMEDGKKVKKKRSPFGWFKKAFTLSEEEKAAFEEKRRQGERDERERYRAYGTRRGGREEEVRFLDGRRVR